MIRLALDSAEFTATLEDLLQKARSPRALVAAAGRAVANTLRAHYRQKDRTEINKLGGQRTHFWLAVSRSVQAPVMEGETRAAVSINHPAIAQKVFGGIISAKRVRYLTIPVTPEAYGRTARTFESETGLKLIFIKPAEKGKAPCLATVAEDSGQVTTQFLLTPSVTQDADPTALPAQDDMEAAAVTAAEAALARQFAK